MCGRSRSNTPSTLDSWDDWVVETRLRKFNAENKELAQNLKKDLDAQRKPASSKSMANSKVKKTLGSEFSSTRESEERSSVPAMGRGQKRGRDNEIEKVGASLLLQDQSATSIKKSENRIYQGSCATKAGSSRV